MDTASLVRAARRKQDDLDARLVALAAQHDRDVAAAHDRYGLALAPLEIERSALRKEWEAIRQAQTALSTV